MADFFNQGWGWFISIISLTGMLGYGLICWVNYVDSNKSEHEPKSCGNVWDGDLEELDTPIPGWWIRMLIASIVFGLFYLILYPGLGSFKGMLGWTQNSQYEHEVSAAQERFGPIFEKFSSQDLISLSANKEAIRSGKRLFQTYCAVCHGSDARGAKNFPNLRDDDWLYGSDAQAIKTSIMQGRSGVMPAWGPILGNDLDDVVNYVQSLSGKQYPAKDIEIGKQRFNQLCTSCHSADGSGSTALGAPNLTDNIWLYGSKFADITGVIRDGKNGIMPAHQKILGEDKVHVLAAYIYSLSANKPVK